MDMVIIWQIIIYSLNILLFKLFVVRQMGFIYVFALLMITENKKNKSHKYTILII